MPYFGGSDYEPETVLLLFLAAWIAYLMLRHGLSGY